LVPSPQEQGSFTKIVAFCHAAENVYVTSPTFSTFFHRIQDVWLRSHLHLIVSSPFSCSTAPWRQVEVSAAKDDDSVKALFFDSRQLNGLSIRRHITTQRAKNISGSLSEATPTNSCST